MQIDAGELSVVVEHLLEVRHEPVRVSGVAVEATAELVVYSPVGHRIEGVSDHLKQRPVASRHISPQEELEDRRLCELGSTAPATVSAIERARQSTNSRIEHLAAEGHARRARDCVATGEHRRQPGTSVDDLVSLRLPQLDDARKHLGK